MPIGQSVIRAVEELEQTGERCCRPGRPPKGEHRNRSRAMQKALRRAVEYGLATRSHDMPYVYKPAPDWRLLLNKPVMRVDCGRVSSVWDLAR
jgi:hypothetical protein